MKETELANHFISYFEGFDVYKEVPGYGIIDIVVLAGNITTAIEVKCSLNFDVIEQAVKNKQLANYSYVAVPHTKGRTFAHRVCKEFGVGILTYNDRRKEIIEVCKPKLNRRIVKLKLKDWMKESEAGSQNNRMTAFKNTVRLVHLYLKSKGGKASHKDVISNVDHHYGSITSAISSLRSLCNSEVITEFYSEQGFFIINTNQ